METQQIHKLKVSYAHFPPFYDQGMDGSVFGIDPSAWAIIAKRLKLDIEFMRASTNGGTVNMVK